MFSHFSRLVYSVIWTAAVICVTNGAPTGEKTMLDQFYEDFKECRVLEYVILPAYKSGNDADEHYYDLSVPLETCVTAPGKNNTAVPICNEAFEMIHNLSTCRDDIKALKEAIPLTFKPINIAVGVDNVCEDFFASQSLLAQKENYVAYKFADKAICPMICQGIVSKACAFLLWGYKVQAQLNDAVHSSITPNQGVSGVQNIEAVGQSENQDDDNGGESAAVHQEKQSRNVSAEKVPTHVKPEVHEGNGPLEAIETSHKSDQLPISSDNPLEPQTKESENVEKIPPTNSELPKHQYELSKGQSGKPEFQKPKSEKSEFLTTKSKELVLPKVQPTEHKLVAKASVSSIADAGKSSTVPLNGTPKNGKAQHVHDGHSEKDPSDANAKTAPSSASSSTANAEPHENANAEGKLIPGKVTEEVVDNKLNDDAETEVGKESKDKSASQSSSVVPYEDDMDKHLLDASEVSAVDQGGTEEETPVSSSAKNEKKEDDPPSDTENKSKVDMPTNDPSAKQQNPENSVPGKTPVATVTKVTNSASKDAASKVISNSQEVLDGESKQIDEDDKQGDEQFDMEGSENSYIGQPIGVSENSVPVDLKGSSVAGTHGSQDSLENNKTPAKVIKKTNAGFPEQEDAHFFFYFVTIVIFAIGGYVLFHNKQKIFALIIEGRHERRRRSGASYRKLETK